MTQPAPAKCVTCGRLNSVFDAASGVETHESAYGHPFKAQSEPTPSERACERCGGPNPIAWHAPSPLWNTVMRTDGSDSFGFCCPTCFILEAQKRGIDGEWHLTMHDYEQAHHVFADGRVWDATQCLWVEPTPSTQGSTAQSVDENSLLRRAEAAWALWRDANFPEDKPVLWSSINTIERNRIHAAYLSGHMRSEEAVRGENASHLASADARYNELRRLFDGSDREAEVAEYDRAVTALHEVAEFLSEGQYDLAKRTVRATLGEKRP